MSIKKTGNSLLISLLLIVAFHFVSGSLPQPAKKRRVELVSADSSTYNRRIANATRHLGNVVFSQNNATLACDSAYFYNDSNMVDAFSHVHIIQGDTLNLYGDRIKYDGNTRIAKMKGNVKLVNKSIVLTTDELIFDLKDNIGNYHTWGKIVDTANVLVSKIGRYYSNDDMFFFKDSVKVTNKDFVLTSDTLKYNSKTERVFIVGPTHIVGTTKRGTLYSERGWYDTRTNIAELYKASKIMGKDQFLQGDTIFYSRDAGTGRARSRVLLSDTTNHVAITGRSGTYNEKTKIAFVTDSAIFMQFSKKDTLFLHADTLRSIPDLNKKTVGKKLVGQFLIAKKSSTPKAVILKNTAGEKISGHSKVPQGKDSVSTKNDTVKVSVLPGNTKLSTTKDSLLRVTVTDKDSTKISTTIKEKPLKKNRSKISSLFGKKEHPIVKDSLSKISIPGKDTAKISSVLKEKPLKKDTAKFTALPGNMKPSTSKDSLSRAAVTAKDSIKTPSTLNLKSLKKDSLSALSDTLHAKDDKDKKIFLAYHRVRFFKKDLQGMCDSLSYQMKDSVMRLFKDPILWSEVHQLSAEKIEYRPHNPGPDIAKLENDGFIISREDSIKFNQISGKILTGYIYNNALKKIEVSGNAITLYYLKNKDHYSGMNKLESSKINVYLKEGKIDSISFFPQPEGKTIPLKDLTPEEAKLGGFVWRESEKPRNRFDLYPVDEKRKKIAGPEKKPASKK